MVWRALTCCVLLFASCLAAHAQAEHGTKIDFDSVVRGKKDRIAGYLSLPANIR
jgi:hypothetical protein